MSFSVSFLSFFLFFFFFNDTATTEIYTLSLHDALPIGTGRRSILMWWWTTPRRRWPRSEEHTSELQSQSNLVCRLLLEKKNKTPMYLIRKVRYEDRRALLDGFPRR